MFSKRTKNITPNVWVEAESDLGKTDQHVTRAGAVSAEMASYWMFLTRPQRGGYGAPVTQTVGMCVFLFVAGFGNLVFAQDRHVTVRGTVFSSNTFPLSAALVSLDDRSRPLRSDINGRFEITSVQPGTYILMFERAGYAARGFRVVIPDTLTGVFDVGAIELTTIDAPTIRVRGVVSESQTAEQVAVVPIALNGVVVAVTDEAGGFQLDSVPVGNNLIEARRIGYMPIAADLEVGENATEITLALQLERLPFRLEDVEVVVEGDRTIYALGRMREFYRRRKSTPGAFITRDQIERRNPMEISDMLRTIPGVRITQSGFERQITIRGCTPMIYLDGMPLRGVELDAVVFPDHVEAVEVHRGAFMPIEFMTFGACAAIVVWTR